MDYTVVFYDKFLNINGVDVKLSEASFDYLTNPPNISENCLHIFITIENLNTSSEDEECEDTEPKYLSYFHAEEYEIQFGNFDLDLYQSDVKFLQFKISDYYLLTITVEQSSMTREL